MKRIVFLACASLLAISAQAKPAGDPWYSQDSFHPTERVKIVVVNDLDVARRNAPVILRRAELPQLAGHHELAMTLVDPHRPGRAAPSKELLALQGAHETRQETNGGWVPYQFDDLDQDGLWDELFFMADFAPHEKKTMYVYFGFQIWGWYPHGTHAGVGSYMRHLVPFWESANVGWKLWYPTDIDVYAKREPILMADHLYKGNMDGYGVSRIDRRLGSDIMQVSNSFGGGGIGLFEDPAKPTQLSRPRFTPLSPAGANFNADPERDTRYAFTVLANGPLRSMVRVKAFNWNSGHGQYGVTQTYTAYAGENYSTAHVQFDQFAPGNAATAFAVGIRKHIGENLFYQDGGMVVSAAPEAIRNPDDVEDNQMGMSVAYAGSALVVPARYDPSYVFAPDYGGNHTFRIAPNTSHSFDYLIAAAWSEGAVLKTAEAFRDYVIRAAAEFQSPIRLADSQPETRAVPAKKTKNE